MHNLVEWPTRLQAHLAQVALAVVVGPSHQGVGGRGLHEGEMVAACQGMEEEEDPLVPCGGVEREGGQDGRGVEACQVGGLGV